MIKKAVFLALIVSACAAADNATAGSNWTTNEDAERTRQQLEKWDKVKPGGSKETRQRPEPTDKSNFDRVHKQLEKQQRDGNVGE